MPSHRDDRHEPGAPLPSAGACLPPVDPRQSQIHEDDIRHQLNCLLDRFDAVGRLGNAVAGGTNNLDAVFTDMLPGQAHSKTLRYSNTGKNAQDVWVVFKASDLGTGDAKTGINSLGTYGEVHVASNGAERFASKNLNDNNQTCEVGTGSPACMPLPSKIKVAAALEPGHTGDWSFSFTPSSQFTGYQGAPMLKLDYDLVATQVGVQPGA